MQSLIVTNAHQIVQGQMPELGRKDGDFFFFAEPGSFYPGYHRGFMPAPLPASYGYSPVFDIQVLSPAEKGN